MKTWEWWVGGIATFVLIGALLLYSNFWNIAALVLPALERAEQTSAPSPSIFTLPPGFSAHVFASTTPGARVITLDPKGTLLVSEGTEGKVVALPDTNSDGIADKTITILSGLKGPHGTAVICKDMCTLYVAETAALTSYTYDADTFSATNPQTLATFPSDGGHSTRTLLESPDNKSLLISIGSSCNVCHEENPLRASIQSFDLATHQLTLFAKGLRNTVFMAIEPITGKVWGADMGRDLLGDNIPPDEINILESGKNYGWPVCYGQNIHDTEFDKNTYIRNPCMTPFETPALIDLQAHSAPLGLAFIPEEGWPEEMAGDLLVAYHGSWNRSEPTGYKIVRFNVSANGQSAEQTPIDFMTGFITDDGEVRGRPVGLLAAPGGILYVTDDRASAVYKITRQ